MSRGGVICETTARDNKSANEVFSCIQYHSVQYNNGTDAPVGLPFHDRQEQISEVCL